MVAPGQHPIDQSAIETVSQTLLTGTERKVSPNNGARGQQSSPNDVRAKVHVMMPVKSLRLSAIETAEFIELRGHNVFE